MDCMNILAIGDVVGGSGTEYIKKNLWELRRAYDIHCVIANGENSAKPNGIDIASARALLDGGVDIITTGNHVWQKREVYSFLDENEYILRPANYPGDVPGKGYTIVKFYEYKILFINLLGTVFMEYGLSCPFACIDNILSREDGRYDFAVIDIHAEATSEKISLAKYIDGKFPAETTGKPRVSFVFGTHTHVQTADEQVLANGTGYITDLGMTGPADSVLGVKNELAIQRFLTRMPIRFDHPEGASKIEGALFCVNLQKYTVNFVKRIRK